MRIISLLPAGTEILCSMELGRHLVGISHECDYPSSIRNLPRVSSSTLPANLHPAEIDSAVSLSKQKNTVLYNIDTDLLVRLHPDWIITQDICMVCAVNSDSTKDALSFFQLEDIVDAKIFPMRGKDINGIISDIQQLGCLLDSESASKSLCEELISLKQEENRISIKPRVLMLEWTDPPWYAGHWVPEQVIAAGGVCLFGLAGKESRPISWNQIKDSNPDIIIGCACGFDTQQNYNQLSELVDLGHLNGLTALKQNKIWAVDANSYFSRPSPRLSKGSKILEQIFTGSTDRLNHSDALHLDLSTYQRKV